MSDQNIMWTILLIFALLIGGISMLAANYDPTTGKLGGK